MFTTLQTPDLESQKTAMERYQTGKGEALWSGVKEGFMQIGVINAAQDNYTYGESIGGGDNVPNWVDAAGNPVDYVEPILTEEEWKASPYFREGKKYDPNMTIGYAKTLAERDDEAKKRAYLWDKSTTGTKAATFGGNFMGGLPDPLNVIPFMGAWGIGGKILEKLGGGVAGRAAVGAVDALIGNALDQPIMKLSADRYQEEYGLREMATNLFIGAVAGTAFGTVHGVLSRVRPEQKMQALSKAVADKILDRPVDVNTTMFKRTPITEDVRAIVSGVEDGGLLLDAIETPSFRQTESQRIMMDTIDMTKADERALRVWRTPEADRSGPDSAFLEAYKAGNVAEYTKANVDQAEARLNELDNQIQKAKDDDSRAALQDTRDAMAVEVEKARQEAVEYADPKPLNEAVAQPEPKEPFPKVTPDTPEAMGKLPGEEEVDFSAMEARFADMEQNDLITPEARELLDAVETEVSARSAEADAYEIAGKCFTRTD